MDAARTAPQHLSRWRRRLDELAAHPEQLRLVLHPVVDVAAGRVAGYEVLSRFASPHGPERWFEAARHLARSAELDLLVLRAALPLRRRLPHGTFLTVNVGPESLGDPRVLELLCAQDLTSVVVEVTEHTDCDAAALSGPLSALRARGARVALDDVGTGHSGLLRMAVVRPDVLKVDLQLVRGLDGDLVKRSVVRFLGECADRLDAWVLAEGVESPAELDVLRSMGVPLVQGFLLARPAEGFARLSLEAHRLLASGAAAPPVPQAPGPAGRLARRTKTCRSAAEAVEAVAGDGAPVVVVDEHDVPRVLVLPAAGAGGEPRLREVVSTLAPETSVPLAAARAVSRAPEVRFDPVVCTDATGRYVGVVGVEDLVLELSGGACAGGPRARDERAGGWPAAGREVPA
ncbi:EAL domain-containing protein [Kineococcus indalonis]|uniref:EAL domain-containing protein n=1 Tax=Kineococcus indalonis TaxID=2696566 RepID=UPI001412C534|nr:EAL domain-containing protein [Kineococcus indalonis]NAZ87689.1 EAL domain-containing protein [Kineococcus indalonis]